MSFNLEERVLIKNIDSLIVTLAVRSKHMITLTLIIENLLKIVFKNLKGGQIQKIYHLILHMNTLLICIKNSMENAFTVILK